MKYFIAIAVLMFPSLTASAADSRKATRLLCDDPRIDRYVESELGVPEYIVGELAKPVSRGEEVSSTLAFLAEKKLAFRMSDPSRELTVRQVDDDRRHGRHIRFDQYHSGVRVVGGELVSHFTADGQLRVINGYYHPEIGIEATPALSSSEASGIAAADFAGRFATPDSEEAELVILPWEREYVLCWHTLLHSDRMPFRWEYFVDANRGEIVYDASLAIGSDEIGTGFGVLGLPRYHVDVWYDGDMYQMRDGTRQLNNNPHGHNGQMPDGSYIETFISGYELPGVISDDWDNFWNASEQRPAVDAHVYSGLVYDWLLREFNRNSYDGLGSTMRSSVNCTIETTSAWWIGTQIVFHINQYGTRSLACCPDVVAHEWAHGVTEHCSDLVFRWESGALNEAFSNMMGAAFEFAHDTMDVPDWYGGENAFIYSPIAMFSMSNPDEFGEPSYYKGTYWYDVEDCTPTIYNDFCYIHRNAGVGHKWFYLLSDGGTFHDVTVNGIGVENAIQIAYHANAYYWTSHSDYHDGALGTYHAAMDLDSTGDWAGEVASAWLAVGIELPMAGLSFDYPLGNPEAIQANEATLIEVEVGGIVNGVPVPGSGQIHYSVDGAEFTVEAMTQLSDNHYSTNLPALNCWQSLSYYFSALEQGGEWYYDPDSLAPFTPAIVDSTPVLFSDDFESDLGWTVYGNASDGSWERGVPVGGTEGAPDHDYDGSGQCFLTGNAAGESDVDDGATNLVSPVFDLDGADGVVRYALWYNVGCAPGPREDLMRVHISNDGGDNWTLAQYYGISLYDRGGWFEHEFTVSDFIEPTSFMRIRFEASDTYWPSCVEAAVDAVEVIRYECQDYVCGDADGSKTVDIDDAVHLINYIFSGGPAPDPLEAGDADYSGEVDIDDVVYLIEFIFGGGPEPCA